MTTRQAARPRSAPPSAAPRGCTNFRLRQLTREVTRHFDASMGAAGLKTTQYSLLSHLDRLGPLRPGDLAHALRMDPSTLTRNLQPLVAQGFAEVRPGDDGRSRRVVATARGRAKRAEAQREWKRAQLALNRRLGAERVAALHALIDDCLATLSTPESETVDE